MLDGPEVDLTLEDLWKTADPHGHRQRGVFSFIDAAVGGSGFLERAIEELHLVARQALVHLEHAGCETACYRCLKSYNNQLFHQHLDWPGILTDLEVLVSGLPEPRPLELGDDHDPRPWLEAFEAGVGSPLELKFLRLFETHGIQVEKQVPVSPEPGGRAISTADFAIQDRMIAVYVDGAAFHTGNRMRRDRIIRKRLRAGSMWWRGMVIRASDLALPDRAVAKLDELSGR
jgi:hypothetical protein